MIVRDEASLKKNEYTGLNYKRKLQELEMIEKEKKMKLSQELLLIELEERVK